MKFYSRPIFQGGGLMIVKVYATTPVCIFIEFAMFYVRWHLTYRYNNMKKPNAQSKYNGISGKASSYSVFLNTCSPEKNVFLNVE